MNEIDPTKELADVSDAIAELCSQIAENSRLARRLASAEATFTDVYLESQLRTLNALGDIANALEIEPTQFVDFVFALTSRSKPTVTVSVTRSNEGEE